MDGYAVHAFKFMRLWHAIVRWTRGRGTRLAGRAQAEGRADDNPESVRKRLQVYTDQTAPVIDFYRQQGELTVVDGVGSLDEVFTRITEALAPAKEVG